MSETATWQPSASIPNLLKRAAVMAEIRRFFTDRGVLEVETPCMSQATVTDIHMVPFETRFVGPGHSQGLNLYLMTSPEYHMKRLLAAGCGPVFQLCRSFRNEEMGRHHNPEFTMLEWYRPCYDMYRLINEVDDLPIGESTMSETATWQPSAPIPNLLKRAAVMAEIRRFFTDRGVLEVETPCMSQATVTDIHLFPFETRFVGPGHSQGLNLYLMTSPEYHMKRLLAAGCGPVFQLCRSFRNEEMGRHHNPEFTMLEWYRPCYDMYRLINEVDDLLQQVLECQPAESLSYQQAFQRHLDIDPLSADKAQLREVAAKLDLSNIADTEEDRDTLLQLLFTMGVEPHIGKDRPTFIYHFPATQASLAQISPEDHRVAERFEVYYKGIELANGFHELTDAHEQRLRFEQDNRKRAARGLPQQPIDNNLLAALEAGLPDCSGVALGVDRVVMLALGAESIGEVIAFTVDRA